MGLGQHGPIILSGFYMGKNVIQLEKSIRIIGPRIRYAQRAWAYFGLHPISLFKNGANPTHRPVKNGTARK